MHDAAHGAYSEKFWVNTLLSKTIWLMGFNDTNWNVQHNGLHHMNTNIKASVDNLGDEDIQAYGLLRLSQHSKLRWIHRWQHFYAWFLYGIVTTGRFFGETFRISAYLKMVLGQRFKIKPLFEYCKIIGLKLIYLFLMVALPILITDFSWWQVIIGFFSISFITSFTFTLIFQLAHIVENAQQPDPVNGIISNDWAIHELQTSSDFKTNNFFSGLIGGLNFQIVHHLYRNVSHRHYKALSKIIQKIAADFSLIYNQKRSFIQALISHYKRLKQLGTT
jgi:linoleoyl-CoA desaturase